MINIIVYILMLVSTVMVSANCDKLQSSEQKECTTSTTREIRTSHKIESNLRVVAYNVKHCTGVESQINYDKIATIINNLDADIICLQEIDSITARSNHCDQLKILAKKTGMYHYFGMAIPYDGGKYGNGILMKSRPLSVSSIALPGTEIRSAAIAEFKNYVVISTHLDLSEKARVESIPLLTNKAKTYNKIVYLAGDFNEDVMDGEFFTKLKRDWNIVSLNKSTYPTRNPSKRIDFIVTLKSQPTECTHQDVVYDMKDVDVATASDHYPLFCDFKK